VEVSHGQSGVLDIAKGDDVAGVEREDAVGADLLDVGHHIGEAAELRLLELDDIERGVEIVDGLVAEITREDEGILAVAGGVQRIARPRRSGSDGH
jgi:hypothetical protein